MWLFRWADHFKTILRLALQSWILLLKWRCLACCEMLHSFWDTHTDLNKCSTASVGAQHPPGAVAGSEKLQGSNHWQEQARPVIVTQTMTKDIGKGHRAAQHLHQSLQVKSFFFANKNKCARFLEEVPERRTSVLLSPPALQKRDVA